MTGITENEIRAILIAAVRVDGAAKITAGKLGISPQYLSDVLRGRRRVTETLAEKLGFKQVILYVPKKEAEGVEG